MTQKVIILIRVFRTNQHGFLHEDSPQLHILSDIFLFLPLRSNPNGCHEILEFISFLQAYHPIWDRNPISDLSTSSSFYTAIVANHHNPLTAFSDHFHSLYKNLFITLVARPVLKCFRTKYRLYSYFGTNRLIPFQPFQPCY